MRRVVTAIALAIAATAGVLLGSAPAQGVVGGSDAIVNPGAVSIYTDNPNRNRCTGVLVEPQWVVTAAHCWYALHQPTVTRVELRIGSTDNRYPRDAAHPSGYVAFTPESYHWPADFDPNTNRSDIMLIKLTAPVPTSVQQPVEWNQASLPTGSVSTVFGWGWVCDGPSGLSCSTWYAGPLQQFSLRKIDDGNCTWLADSRQDCLRAAYAESGNACLGDSGAGTFTKGIGSAWYLREVIVGDGDANTSSCAYGPNGTPGLGLTTDVSAYRPWMSNVIVGDIIGEPTTPPATQRQFELVG